MRGFLTLARRELGSYFISLIGYVIIAVSVFQMGLSFYILLAKLQSESTPMPITEMFYSTPFFWMILLLSTPIITMRLFALEKYSGTFETLMTTPVSDLQVVLAKFFAAFVFYALMWLPLLGCLFIIRHYTNDPAPLDYRIIGSTFLGIFLVGMLFISAGCLASALTKNQIIAAMVSFALGISLFMLSFLGERVSVRQEWAGDTLRYINMVEHMQDFSRGIIDTRCVTLYVSASLLFLFLTYRVVESRRWK